MILGRLCFTLAVIAGTMNTAAAQTSACARAAEARSVVFLARYSGAQNGDALNHLSNFLAFLGDRIEIWRTSLERVAETAPFLRKLRVVQEKELTKLQVLTADEAYQAWRGVADRLQVLYGSVAQHGGRYVITSRVHLGELEGTGAPTSVVVSLPSDEAIIGVANDAHSLVTYYALALEAYRIACPTAVTLDLLSAALESATDLRRRIPNDREIDRIGTAVAALATKLRTAGQQ